MTEDDALKCIRESLETALDKKDVVIDLKTDLKEGVLDSLDSMVFLLELEQRTGCKFPDSDIGADGYFRVANLVSLITSN